MHKPVMNPALEGVVRAVPEVCSENAAKRTIQQLLHSPSHAASDVEMSGLKMEEALKPLK